MSSESQTSGSDGGDARRLVLLDSSVAVPFLVAAFPTHEALHRALAGRRIGLAGHAAFETYSVLTRMPQPHRLTSGAAARVLTTNFAEPFHPTPATLRDLLPRLAAAGIGGGAIYDALVAAAAVDHDALLATRDRRALDTYRAVGAGVELVP